MDNDNFEHTLNSVSDTSGRSITFDRDHSGTGIIVIFCQPRLTNKSKQNGSLTTLVITDCVVPSDGCVLLQPMTVTAAPGTFRFQGQGHWYDNRYCVADP